jgi:acyl-CoA hydrolase
VVVEASAITEDGGIIPGASVGASPELIQMADKVDHDILTDFEPNTNSSVPDYYRSQHRNSGYEGSA